VIHSNKNGSAEDNASRCALTITSATAHAMMGLAIMSAANRSNARPPASPADLAAVVAAVSHSSKRRLVIVRRTSVTTMA
jgi:hypothetical protein